jgi:hypothetical protein
MEQSYEDLVGGFGRSVFYRATRFRPRSLLRGFPTKLRVGDLQVLLYDLSQTGLSFHLARSQAAPETGTVLPVRLSLGKVKAFVGRGKVVRAQAELDRTKVAVHLIDGLLEPAKLAALRNELAFQDEMKQGTAAFAAVSDGYRSVCADASVFLNHWRSLLDRREQEMVRSESIGAQTALTDLESAIENRMRGEWTEIRGRANESISGLSVSCPEFIPTKRYTELQVTPLMLRAPIWERAYTKPLGYPGDYQLMNYMYDARREGETIFARILHQLGREERLAATVSTRRQSLMGYIGAAIDRFSGGAEDVIRVTNLGAGPAREIEDYLRASKLSRPVLFTLIDQDEDALAFATERLRRIGIHHGSNLEVRSWFVSFKQLFGRPELASQLKDQDLVYSAGLLDYLPVSAARLLISELFSLVKRRGSLVLGNAADHQDATWVPEFVLDWHMHYRRPEALAELAGDLDGMAKVVVENDASGTWNFLVAQRL